MYGLEWVQQRGWVYTSPRWSATSSNGELDVWKTDAWEEVDRYGCRAACFSFPSAEIARANRDEEEDDDETPNRS